MKIVLHPPVTEELKQQVQRTVPNANVVMADKETVLTAIPDADILFGVYNTEILDVAKNLKWIQTTSAGMDGRHAPPIANDNITVTNASGVHAIQVSEHALALTFALARGLHASIRHQFHRRWQAAPLNDLYGATIGIIGFGGIGRHYAARIRGFEPRIIAVDVQGGEKPDYVESLWSIDRLDDLLTQSDYVFLACPHTEQTRKLINARTLDLMKPTAFLINTARGGIVDEAALIEALQTKKIAGAGLDVFETEPLPENSPLWDLENVILTTHTAGASPNRHNRTVGFFCENLKRYLAGQPLFNEIDKTLGYPRLDRRKV